MNDELKDRITRGLRAPTGASGTAVIKVSMSCIIEIGIDADTTLQGEALAQALREQFGERYEVGKGGPLNDSLLDDFEVIEAYRDDKPLKYDPIVHKTIDRNGNTYELVPVKGKDHRSFLHSRDVEMLETAAAHFNARIWTAAGNRTTEFPPGPFFVRPAKYSENTMLHTLEFEYPVEMGNFIAFKQLEREVKAFEAAWNAARPPRK